MREDVLKKLARVGVHPDAQGNVRLYHTTDPQSAQTIVAEGKLRPQQPEDLAERALRRGGGAVFLSSSPDIAKDLGKGDVVLAIDIPAEDTPAEVIRAAWGDPPRVELEVQLPAGAELQLAFVERLDREVSPADLPPAAREAIALFEASEVGQQLADHDEKEGRCQRASMRFISALRHVGADGTLVAWSGDDWWHSAVLIAGSDNAIVDLDGQPIRARGVEEGRSVSPCRNSRPRGRALGLLRALRHRHA